MIVRVYALLLFFLLIFLASCDSNEPDEEEPLLPRAVAEQDYTVTDSGLKIFDFVVGDTTLAPADTGTVMVVDYIGWLENGQVFDTSIQRGPFQFTLGVDNLIDGWQEGLVGMYPGGDRQIVIPPELGYGSTGSGSGAVPPNETITFEVFYFNVN